MSGGSIAGDEYSHVIINPNTHRPYPQDFFRDYARGQPCLIRIAPVAGLACAHPDTTVLCHLTMSGLKGMGMKLNDLLGGWGCGTCHGILDGQIRPKIAIETNLIKIYHHEGVARTIDQLTRAGVLAYED